MDVATIDSEFSQLQQETEQSVQTIQQLAQKMQAAASSGDSNSKEWLLDLKAIALQIQQEQLQTQALLQALHEFTSETLARAQAAPVQQAPVAQAAPVASHFGGGGFGQAMVSGMGMGAGFGLADSVISSIFG
jgi:hypothetical protein